MPFARSASSSRPIRPVRRCNTQSPIGIPRRCPSRPRVIFSIVHPGLHISHRWITFGSSRICHQLAFQRTTPSHRHNLRRGDLVVLVISSSILRHSDGSIARAAGAHRRRTTARRSAVLLRRSGGSADPVVLAVLVRLSLLGGHAGHSARSDTCRARRSRRAVTTCSTEMRLGHLHRTEAGALAGVSRRGGRGWSARKTLRTVAFRRGGCGARVLRHLRRLGSGRHAGRVERLDGVGSRIRKVNRGVVLRAGRVELGSAGFECSVNEEAMTTHHAVIKVVSVRPPALSEEEP